MPPARRPQLLLVILLVAASCPQAAFAAPLLGADYLGFPVGPRPRLLVAGDLTKDRVDDLVVVDQDGIAILVANRDGTFAPQNRIEGVHASAIAISDLTGDRIADLAVAVTDAAELRIYPGRGDGTFDAPRALPFVAASPGVLARDLDGDGAADLAASDPGAPTVWVWIAERGGTFRAPTQSTVLTGPGPLLAGDMNGDGRPELFALKSGGGGFTRLMNDGFGNFGTPLASTVPDGSGLGTTGDFNGDGIADLAIPTWSQATSTMAVIERLGRADGSFRISIRILTGLRADGLAAADLDGDGFDDLVVFAGGRFLTHKGSSIGLGVWSPTTFANQVDHTFIVGRFDSDDRVDLAGLEQTATGGVPECPLYAGSTAFTWKGDGTGGFAHLSRLDLAATAWQLASLDFDHDGNPDLVVSTTSATLRTLHARGDGGFDLVGELPINGTTSELRTIDVDGDGSLEVVALLSRELRILDCGPGGSLTLRASLPLVDFASSFDAADFDGDGHLDFVVAKWQLATIELYLSRDRDLWERSAIDLGGLRPRKVTASDLDRDGHPDLLFGLSDRFELNSLMCVEHNRGDGTFELRDSLAIDGPVQAIAILDIDGDGDPEIVLGESPSGCSDERVGAHLLRAINGALATIQGPLFMGGAVHGIELADLTGDGLADLVTTGNRSRVDVRAGLLDGTFGERQEFGVSGGVGDLAVLDANRDGRLDVLVTSGDGIAVLPNVGGALMDPLAVAARLGGGGSDAVLAWGKQGAISLVIASGPSFPAGAIDPASVHLAGAAAIRGRASFHDGVRPVLTPDACVRLADHADGLVDLELAFREDEVLDGWLRSQTARGIERGEPDAYTAVLPFTAKLFGVIPIAGTACALIVGRPAEQMAASTPSLRAFGLATSFESGVGVVLDLPAPAAQVGVSVYDVAGRRVASLHEGGLGPGVHRLTWSALDAPDARARPGAGIYFARAVVDGRVLRTRILVAR